MMRMDGSNSLDYRRGHNYGKPMPIIANGRVLPKVYVTLAEADRRRT